MTKRRLDQALTERGLAPSRSQAENWIRLGEVTVGGRVITKPGYFVHDDSRIQLTAQQQYVSRAGLKLASVATVLGLDFKGKTVLDIGSSTGGFTDYALQHGAKKVYAVDVGTDQLHPKLRAHPLVELYEKTDVRNFRLQEKPDIILIDVSFISLRDILLYVTKSLSEKHTLIAAMAKPQFEAGQHQINKGVIKNDAVRRQILKEFEIWTKQYLIIVDKHDSDVAGSKGNRERFYLLRPPSS